MLSCIHSFEDARANYSSFVYKNTHLVLDEKIDTLLSDVLLLCVHILPPDFPPKMLSDDDDHLCMQVVEVAW